MGIEETLASFRRRKYHKKKVKILKTKMNLPLSKFIVGRRGAAKGCVVVSRHEVGEGGNNLLMETRPLSDAEANHAHVSTVSGSYVEAEKHPPLETSDDGYAEAREARHANKVAGLRFDGPEEDAIEAFRVLQKGKKEAWKLRVGSEIE